LRAVFEAPTIALLAKQLDDMAQLTVTSQPRQIVRIPRERYQIRMAPMHVLEGE